MYSLEELSAMLGNAGLKTRETYGDFSGGEFSKDSPRMIIIAEKT